MVRVITCLLVAVASYGQSFDQALHALNSGDYTAAEQGFQQVLASSPNHIGALQNLGLVYSRTGRFDQAISTFHRALELRPADQALLLDLGLAFLKRNSYTEALPVFQRIVDTVPAARDANLLYLLTSGYLKQNPAGQPDVDAFLNKVPPPPAGYVRCKLYGESGRYEEAAAECRKAAGIPGVHRELGKVLVDQHSPAAEPELRTAIREDSADSVAAYYLGLALLQDGKAAEAAPQLQRAIQLDPAFWGSYYYLGKADVQLQQAAQAVPLLRKAAELNPGASVLFYELGRALQATGHNEEAERAMQRVRELRAQELAQDAQALHRK